MARHWIQYGTYPFNTKLSFNMKGGGWCYDNITCSARILENGFIFGNLVSSNFWPESKELEGKLMRS